MSDIARWKAAGGEWVRYDDHRSEVERVMADVVKLRIDLNSAQVAANQRRGEVERLIAERDKIHAEVQRLTQILNGRRATTDRVIAERNEAQAEVERLKEQVAALTVAVEQADEMKAHAEASAAAEEAETDRVMSERDAAQAEVERLTQELDGLRAIKQRIIAERDLAQGERERLQDLLRCERQELSTLRERLRVVQANPCAQNLDMANGQAILDSSRPTDEDIWREGFMRCLNDVAAEDWRAQADLVLTTYRERWPR